MTPKGFRLSVWQITWVKLKNNLLRVTRSVSGMRRNQIPYFFVCDYAHFSCPSHPPVLHRSHLHIRCEFLWTVTLKKGNLFGVILLGREQAEMCCSWLYLSSCCVCSSFRELQARHVIAIFPEVLVSTTQLCATVIALLNCTQWCTHSSWHFKW